MSSPDPKPPAGWYDDATLLGIKRYWDGSAWTERTAPAGEVPRDRPSRTSTIIAAVAVLVAIAAVVFALTKPPEVLIEQAAPSPSASPSSISVPAGDYSDFSEAVTGDLDDFDNDLDDVETTIDENGYWRLLSNTAELRFNLEQLRTATAPSFLAGEWDDALDALDDALQDLAATIQGTQKEQRAALDVVREASSEARGLVELLGS